MFQGFVAKFLDYRWPISPHKTLNPGPRNLSKCHEGQVANLFFRVLGDVIRRVLGGSSHLVSS